MSKIIKKQLKNILILCLPLLMLVCVFSVVNAASGGWSGDVGYNYVVVSDNKLKAGRDGKNSININWTGATTTSSFKLRFVVEDKNDSNAYKDCHTFLSNVTGSGYTIKDWYYKLSASREYRLDPKQSVNGTWSIQ